MARELMFSVSIKDCRVDTFRAGGKGGQNQNKVESGVRVVHEPSGAVGVARDTRDQLQNKRNAWRRMVESDQFRNWLKLETARRMTGETLKERIDKALRPENLRVEIRGEDGKWQLLESAFDGS